MAADPAIETRDLRMTYGDVEAVRGVDLTVERGRVFALLGPNGAGKTTLLEHLEGFQRRTGGTASVLGVDPQAAGPAWRDRIGVVLQESSIEAQLTVSEVVRLYAGYHEHPLAVDETLRLVGLAELGDRRGGRLSGGQQRRVDVALALVGDPELVFLDEPTTGFDPSARRATWDMIDGLKDLGKTIVLTTHYLEEAERLADRVAVLVAGRVVAEGTPDELRERHGGQGAVSFAAAAAPGGWAREGDRWARASGDPLVEVAALAAWAREQDVVVAELEVRRPSLEDVYLRLLEEHGR